MDRIDKAQQAEQEAAEDAKAKRAKEKRDEEARRKQALSDYAKLVSDVRDLAVMCETRAFKSMVREFKKCIEQAKDGLLIADKPRDIAHHQEAVRVLTEALGSFREPVDMLNKYISDMPLFAQDFKVRAQWMTDLFQVDIREEA